MKILQVCSYYTTSKLYENLFDSLSELKKESDIFYFCSNKTDTDKLKKDIIVSKAYGPIENYLFFLKHKKTYKSLKEKICPDDYDLSHAHSLFSNGYIAYKLYKEFKLPYIVAVRRTDIAFFAKYKPYLKSLGGEILKNAKKVIFISQAYKEHTERIFAKYIDLEDLRKKSLVIANGIDEVFIKNNIVNKEKPGSLRLIYVGKVDDANKNVKTLVKLGKVLNEKRDNFKLVLVGRCQKKSYRELIDKDFIEYHDRSSHEEIIEYLRGSSIFIMPSFSETFGLVYAEAMSQALPVIYTRGQGFDGFFKEGQVGFSVEAKNILEMQDRIEKIERDYENISRRASKFSLDFNWKDIAKTYSDIYEEIDK